MASHKVFESPTGRELVSKSLDLWASFNRVKPDFSGPEKPTGNAMIESFNGMLRDEYLNQPWFFVARQSSRGDRSVEGVLQARSSASCSGQPDADGIRAAVIWACPDNGPAWLTTRLVPSCGRRHRRISSPLDRLCHGWGRNIVVRTPVHRPQTSPQRSAERFQAAQRPSLVIASPIPSS